MEKLSEKFLKFADKLNQNVIMGTIRDSFLSIMSFVMVGSIGILLGSVLFSANGLGGLKGLEWLLEYTPLFTKLNYATLNILALLVAFQIGRNMAKRYNSDEVYCGMLSLVNFIIAIPITTSLVVEGVSEPILVSNVLSSTVTGAQGLFVAMIVGLIGTFAFCKLEKIKRLKITLPDSVPPMVSQSFSSLIPAVLTCLLISLFSFGFEKLTGVAFFTFIYNTVQTPIAMIFENPIGIIFVTVIAQILWICGIHGATVVGGIINPTIIAALATNAALVESGKMATEIVTKPFWNMYCAIGGSGSTIGLLIAIFIVSKREDDKSIAKLSIFPGIFGINEPVIFGIPLVLNMQMAIPFILAPAITAAIGYFSIYFGIAAKIISDVPWCMPPVLNGFIATGGDIMTCLVQIVCIGVSTLIYLPFIKMRNKALAK